MLEINKFTLLEYHQFYQILKIEHTSSVTPFSLLVQLF